MKPSFILIKNLYFTFKFNQMIRYFKSIPHVPYEDFEKKIMTVTDFKSTTGKRYEVQKIEEHKLRFRRVDADKKIVWSLDLKNLYSAYITLEDFKTESFRPFVPRRHSPARGLLIHIGLLKAKN